MLFRPLSLQYPHNRWLVLSVEDDVLCYDCSILFCSPHPFSVLFSFDSFRCCTPPSCSREGVLAINFWCGWINLVLQIAWQAAILGFGLLCSCCRNISRLSASKTLFEAFPFKSAIAPATAFYGDVLSPKQQSFELCVLFPRHFFEKFGAVCSLYCENWNCKAR